MSSPTPPSSLLSPPPLHRDQIAASRHPADFWNLEQLEIDITWECNLHCHNCDRSCRQAPTTERMTIEQIEYFLQQTKMAHHQWKRIRVMGGEPTLHPELDKILDRILTYRTTHQPKLEIVLVSNGHGKAVASVLDRIFAASKNTQIKIRNSQKKDPVQEFFEPFNMAPVDDPRYVAASYNRGCWIPRDCGIGLNRYGFYPCAVAGGIDRIFGLGVALHNIPQSVEQFCTAMSACCRYCGHFLRNIFVPKATRPRLLGEPQSPSWQRAYHHLSERSTLPLYGGFGITPRKGIWPGDSNSEKNNAKETREDVTPDDSMLPQGRKRFCHEH